MDHLPIKLPIYGRVMSMTLKEAENIQAKLCEQITEHRAQLAGEKRMKYTLSELQNMPTISQGYFDNLKIETSTIKVWLSRMTTADGAEYNNGVTIEKLVKGVWETVDEYQAI